jgi:hypothetical protein
LNLDGLVMHVSSTADSGVVGSDTRLYFQQRGARVFARYAGGAVRRGVLVGRLDGRDLRFRYVQAEGAAIHAGRSVADVLRLADGRVRILEHFAWTTREGTGTNVFDEAY